MNQITTVKNASANLSQTKPHQKVIVGFDGFIDEIIHVVKERTSDTSYSRIETITEFSHKIAAASGLSANIEFVPQETKLGGNGPIMANALGAQGYNIAYIGALGDGGIDPIFKEFASRCSEVITLTAPGKTDALEFNDGKLMMAKMNNLLDVNWERLLKLTSKENLIKMAQVSSLLSFTNWTELPNFNSLLEGFYEVLAEAGHRPSVFIDLADPAKRTDEDITAVLKLIVSLQDHAEVLFGLNENESIQIAQMYNITTQDFSHRATKIREAMGISAVVIHPISGAAVATKECEAWIDGPYTKKPKLTTGAGDNFNSGFCNGWLAGLSPEECIAVGVCTSGFYVRECHSPTRTELLDFMNRWVAVQCGEIA